MASRRSPDSSQASAQQPSPADTLLPARRLAALRARLLAHFDARRRDLPWRRTRDPWAILVSEVMLQQTTVAAVLPYYERFLRRWPTPQALAAASHDELLSEWAGLGYYRRAHNLQAAALAVCEGPGVSPTTHGSSSALPRDAAGLRSLPGVGEYTAAAVASIAYGEAVAALDGNVERVLCRLFALPGDPRRARARAVLRSCAGALLDPARPGDFNQALMELGATLCRPTSPRCEECPLRADCRALAAGQPEAFPQLAPRPAAIAVRRALALVQRGERVLLRRRESAPNAGFWELPDVDLPRALHWASGAGGPAAPSPAHLTAMRTRLTKHLRAEHGLLVRFAEPGPEQRHSITRHQIRVLPFAGRLLQGRVQAPLAWGALSETDRPLTTLTRRILAAAAERRSRVLG
ncbi:MAG: A/G-specific adenine glycosylase [Planctomycetota bacterium]